MFRRYKKTFIFQKKEGFFNIKTIGQMIRLEKWGEIKNLFFYNETLATIRVESELIRVLERSLNCEFTGFPGGAGYGAARNTLAGPSESEHLHRVVGVRTESVQDCA